MSFVRCNFRDLSGVMPDWVFSRAKAESATLPELRKVGRVTQLYVDGKPFLALGGELGKFDRIGSRLFSSGAGKVPADESEHGPASGVLGSASSRKKGSSISRWCKARLIGRELAICGSFFSGSERGRTACRVMRRAG